MFIIIIIIIDDKVPFEDVMGSSGFVKLRTDNRHLETKLSYFRHFQRQNSC